MIWSIDLDDFKSFCSNKTYPLTRMIGSSLREINRNKCARLQKVDDVDIMEYTSKVTKWTFSSNEKINPQDDKFNYLPDKPKTTSNAKTWPKRVSPSTSTSTRRTFLTIRFRPHLLTSTKKLIQYKPIRPTLKPNYKFSNTTKYNIYLLSRSDKINTILLAFQNSKLKNDNNIIDQIFKQIVSNMSQSMASTPKALFLKNNLKFNTPAKLTSLSKIIIKKLEISKNDFTDDDVKEKVCQNLNDGEFVRDPSDCTSFFTCFLGKPITADF